MVISISGVNITPILTNSKQLHLKFRAKTGKPLKMRLFLNNLKSSYIKGLDKI